MKRSGFAVKITAWIDADPHTPSSMVEAGERVGDLKIDMANLKFTVLKQSSRFMLSREVPDAIAGSEPVSSNEPVAAEAGTRDDYVRPPRLPSTSEVPGETLMPPIPAAMKR